MEQKYAQALMHLLESGTAPEKAVAGIAQALKRSGRERLMPRVGRAFERLAVRRVMREVPVVTVAHERDVAGAKAAAGESDALVRLDDTLIGGWCLQKAGMLTDNSYKKHLLEIYRRTMRA